VAFRWEHSSRVFTAIRFETVRYRIGRYPIWTNCVNFFNNEGYRIREDGKMGRHREFDADEALDAALEVFWDKGYEGASFEDLTRATRVARPGLYSAFGNKEALFRKALDRYDERYMSFMSEALNAPTSREVVRAILQGSVAVLTLNGESRGCLGINGALACSSDSIAIQQELAARRKTGEAALRVRLEAARDQGELPASSDCAMLASYVMTVNQGMAVQAKAGTPKATLDALIEHVLSTWPSTDPR
jgi:AcrR family transcriptional regulator